MTGTVLALSNVGSLQSYDASYYNAKYGLGSFANSSSFYVANATYQYTQYFLNETFFSFNLSSIIPKHAVLRSVVLRCAAISSPTVTDWAYTDDCYIVSHAYTYAAGAIDTSSWVHQGNTAVASPVATTTILGFSASRNWDLSPLLSQLQSDLSVGATSQCIMFGPTMRNDITPTGVNQLILPSTPDLLVRWSLSNGEPFMGDLL